MDIQVDQIQQQLEKLARLPRAQRIAAVAGVAVLILATYAYFFYMPARTQLAALDAREQQLQRQVSELKAVATNLERFKAELADLETKLDDAVRKLPDSKELPVLLTDISTLGKDAGLEFKAFRPQNEVPHGFYAEVPIEIEFSGRYHDIARFFDRVAHLPRIVNVGRLEVRIADEDTEETRLQVKGEATTFRFLGSPAAQSTPPTQNPRGRHGAAARGGRGA